MTREEQWALLNRPATYVRTAMINDQPGVALLNGSGVVIGHAPNRLKLDMMIIECGYQRPETIH